MFNPTNTKFLDPKKLRQHVLDMVYTAKSGHIGGSFSIIELVSTLFSMYDLTSSELCRDRLILSKGHAVPVIYAVYRELGIIDDKTMKSFRQLDSPLQGHPDCMRFPMLDATTGSLGQGLSIAIGHAIALKRKGSLSSVFCICGDGEMQEGQVWEAMMLASHLKLGNLYCIVDVNSAQNDGRIKLGISSDSLHKKAVAFGWQARVVNRGNDCDWLKSYFIGAQAHSSMIDYPHFLVINTLKGAGVSFMEDNLQWHCKVPSDKEYEAASKELRYA